jgi:hypothetical protein
VSESSFPGPGQDGESDQLGAVDDVELGEDMGEVSLYPTVYPV